MKRGYITVFFALIFMILVSFVLSIFQGIKVNAARLKAECAFSVAANSVLGEYHTELLDMYDLFYIDTAYKSGSPDYHQIEAHMWEYIKKNYNKAPASVEICQITMATDNQGTAYRKQISDYMKDRIGVSYAEQLMSLYQTVSKEGILNEDSDPEDIYTDEWINTISGMEEIPEETWKEVEKYCPIEKIRNERNSFVLRQVVDNEAAVSKKAVNLTNYLSNRTLIKGTGTDKKQDFLDKVYFICYVFDKFLYYSEEEGNGLLDYEIEYLIGGANSDYENLSKVAKKMLLIRESINLTYLLTDSEKMSLIKEISAALAAVVVCPEIEPVLAVVLTGLWSYAESIADVQILFRGGSVPLMKSKNSWNTDLDSVFNLNFSTQKNTQAPDSMNYKQYLELLLLFSNNEKITYRSMDLIEMHIRQTKGNEDFRIDGCAEDFVVNIVFDIPAFGSYQIVRRFGYLS